jgi:hypothetical protein
MVKSITGLVFQFNRRLFSVLGTDGITQTGMVLVDVGLLSGFLPLGLAAVDPIRKVETPPGRAVLYLDSVSSFQPKSIPKRHLVSSMMNSINSSAIFIIVFRKLCLLLFQRD